MRWMNLGQQYAGEWVDGVQHGRGSHVWTLQGSGWGLYSQNNEYTGEFVQGQRHGRGTFSYAGGAVYEGEWKNNKKHGKGRFTFEDGRVFEAEFVDDQMVTPTVHISGAPNPLCGASALSDSDSSTSKMGLNIERVLDNIPERKRNTERKQVEFVVLWQNTQLRSIYSFYSGLGRSHASRLSHMQLWRLLKDCKVHHHGMSLTQMDRWIKEDGTTEIHSPFTTMLLCVFISSLVIIAYNIYHRDLASAENLLAACLSKLLTDDVLPNAMNVKGFLFRHPDLSEVSTSYVKRCWQIYQAYCRVSATKDDQTMTYRQLMWMFKDLQLLDNNLTAAKLLEIINAESPDSNNLSSCLDHEITFLEFLEVLLGCAEVKCQQVSDDLEDGGGETNGTLTKVRNCSAKSISVPANSPNTPEILSPKSAETIRSVDTTESPVAPHVGSQQTSSKVSEEDMGEQDRHTQIRRMKTKQSEQEVWAQTVQQFFNHVFFPAFEHYEAVNRYLEETLPAQSFINTTTQI